MLSEPIMYKYLYCTYTFNKFSYSVSNLSVIQGSRICKTINRAKIYTFDNLMKLNAGFSYLHYETVNLVVFGAIWRQGQ